MNDLENMIVYDSAIQCGAGVGKKLQTSVPLLLFVASPQVLSK